jgi:hypothetical protein
MTIASLLLFLTSNGLNLFFLGCFIAGTTQEPVGLAQPNFRFDFLSPTDSWNFLPL